MCHSQLCGVVWCGCGGGVMWCSVVWCAVTVPEGTERTEVWSVAVHPGGTAVTASWKIPGSVHPGSLLFTICTFTRSFLPAPTMHNITLSARFFSHLFFSPLRNLSQRCNIFFHTHPHHTPPHTDANSLVVDSGETADVGGSDGGRESDAGGEGNVNSGL